jgi:hypothetical protein
MLLANIGECEWEIMIPPCGVFDFTTKNASHYGRVFGPFPLPKRRPEWMNDFHTVSFSEA